MWQRSPCLHPCKWTANGGPTKNTWLWTLGYMSWKALLLFFPTGLICHAFTLTVFKIWGCLYCLYSHWIVVMTGAWVFNPEPALCSRGWRPVQAGGQGLAFWWSWKRTSCPDSNFSNFLLLDKISIGKEKQTSQIKTLLKLRLHSEFTYCFVCFVISKIQM